MYWFIFTDSQPNSTIKKQILVKRSNSDSDISYCYTFQKYSETDAVFNITGMEVTNKINWWMINLLQ